MITIIHGGHRGGLSMSAAQTFKQLLDKRNLENKLYSLRDDFFSFCCGNQPCQDSGKCVHNDYITHEVVPVIAKSDSLFFFTPTYFNMPPAILKSFMDRCNLLLAAEKRKHPRFGAWITGQESEESLEDNYRCLATFAEICELEPIDAGKIIRNEGDPANRDLSHDDIDKLMEVVKEICKAI